MYDYDLSMSSDIFKQQKHIQLFWVTPNQKERWQLNAWNAEGFLHARDNYVIHDLSKAIHKKEKNSLTEFTHDFPLPFLLFCMSIEHSQHQLPMLFNPNGKQNFEFNC